MQKCDSINTRNDFFLPFVIEAMKWAFKRLTLSMVNENKCIDAQTREHFISLEIWIGDKTTDSFQCVSMAISILKIICVKNM